MTNKWIIFLKKNSGMGLSLNELSKLYNKKSKSIPKQSKKPSTNTINYISPLTLSKKRSKKRSKKLSKQKSKKQYRLSKKQSCKNFLKKKISINMKEYKQGRYISPKQAIAVSYSQVRKYKPNCKKYFKRS